MLGKPIPAIIIFLGLGSYCVIVIFFLSLSLIISHFVLDYQSAVTRNFDDVKQILSGRGIGNEYEKGCKRGTQ